MLQDRELQIATLLRADDTLSTLLPGGIYTDQELGLEGFERDSGTVSENAFDADGFIKPSIVIHTRGAVPFGPLADLNERLTSTIEYVEIYFYQHRKTDIICDAKELVYSLLQGVRLPDSYPLTWDFETPYYYDLGPVQYATVLRQDWAVVSVRKPVSG